MATLLQQRELGREIPLTQGFKAIVDEDIYGYLAQFKWRITRSQRCGGKVYGIRHLSRVGRKEWYRDVNIPMHQEIIRLHGLKWRRITHLNGNSLDNRFANLAPQKNTLELYRRADAIREYFKAQAIREYWDAQEQGGICGD